MVRAPATSGTATTAIPAVAHSSTSLGCQTVGIAHSRESAHLPQDLPEPFGGVDCPVRPATLPRCSVATLSGGGYGGSQHDGMEAELRSGERLGEVTNANPLTTLECRPRLGGQTTGDHSPVSRPASSWFILPFSQSGSHLPIASEATGMVNS